MTTIIAAVILYLYGSGPIRGFATTLTIGLLTNLFTSIFVSKTLFELALRRQPARERHHVEEAGELGHRLQAQLERAREEPEQTLSDR